MEVGRIYYKKEDSSFIIFKFLEFRLNKQGQTMITLGEMKKITHNDRILEEFGGADGFVNRMASYGMQYLYVFRGKRFIFKYHKPGHRENIYYRNINSKHLYYRANDYNEIAKMVEDFFDDMYRSIKESKEQIEEFKRKFEYDRAEELIVSLIEDFDQKEVYIEEGDIEFFDRYFLSEELKKNNTPRDTILGDILRELDIVTGFAHRGDRGKNNLILEIDMDKVDPKYMPDIEKRKIEKDKRLALEEEKQINYNDIEINVYHDDDYEDYYYEEEEDDDYDFYEELYKIGEENRQEYERNQEAENEDYNDALDDIIIYGILSEEDY